MSATEVALPAEISGKRFSGQSVASPKTTRPSPLADSPPPPLSLSPPQADSTIAPVTPVATSITVRLLNFTFACLLDPRRGGGRSGRTDPGSPGGLGFLHAPCPAAVGTLPKGGDGRTLGRAGPSVHVRHRFVTCAQDPRGRREMRPRHRPGNRRNSGC